MDPRATDRGKGKKRAPPKINFWDYVDKAKVLDHKLCKLCGHKYAKSTGLPRIKWHLSGEIGRGVVPCTGIVPREVQEAALEALGVGNKTHKNMASSSNVNRNAISTGQLEHHNEVDNLAGGIGVTICGSVPKQVQEASFQAMDVGYKRQENMASSSYVNFNAVDNLTRSMGSTQIEVQGTERVAREGRTFSRAEAGSHMENVAGEPMHITDSPGTQKWVDSVLVSYTQTNLEDYRYEQHNEVDNLAGGIGSITEVRGTEQGVGEGSTSSGAEAGNLMGNMAEEMRHTDTSTSAERFIDLDVHDTRGGAWQGTDLVEKHQAVGLGFSPHTQEMLCNVFQGEMEINEEASCLLGRSMNDAPQSGQKTDQVVQVLEQSTLKVYGVNSSVGYERSIQMEVRGMEQGADDDLHVQVFNILRFSYDRLEDSILKQCFLYCALFLEDFKIPKEDLIGYLIDEGVLKGPMSRDAKFVKGHSMLNRLESVSFLLSGKLYDDRRYVVMHDLVREMALKLIMQENSPGMIKSGVQFPTKKRNSGIQLKELWDVEEDLENHASVSPMQYQLGSIHEWRNALVDIEGTRNLLQFMTNGRTHVPLQVAAYGEEEELGSCSESVGDEDMVDFHGFEVRRRHNRVLELVHAMDKDFWVGAKVTVKRYVGSFLMVLGDALCLSDRPRRSLSREELEEIVAVIEEAITLDFKVESLRPLVADTRELLASYDDLCNIEFMREQIEDMQKKIAAMEGAIQSSARIQDNDRSLFCGLLGVLFKEEELGSCSESVGDEDMVDFHGCEVRRRHSRVLELVHAVDKDFWVGAKVTVRRCVSSFLMALGDTLCLSDRPRSSLSREDLEEIVAVIEEAITLEFKVESLRPLVAETRELLANYDAICNIKVMREQVEDMQKKIAAMEGAIQSRARVQDNDHSLFRAHMYFR